MNVCVRVFAKENIDYKFPIDFTPKHATKGESCSSQTLNSIALNYSEMNNHFHSKNLKPIIPTILEKTNIINITHFYKSSQSNSTNIFMRDFYPTLLECLIDFAHMTIEKKGLYLTLLL